MSARTLKITWGSRVFLLYLGLGVYRASSGDEWNGTCGGDDACRPSFH